MSNIEKALDILEILQCNSRDFYDALEGTGYDDSTGIIIDIAKAELAELRRSPRGTGVTVPAQKLEELQLLHTVVCDFIQENNIGSLEDLFCMDHQESLVFELAKDCCEIIGYKENDDE